VSEVVSKNANQPVGLVSLRSVRSLKKIIKFIFVYPLTLLDHISANRKSQVISVAGHQQLIDELPIIIYVHYSSQNIVSEREKQTLLALQNIGFQICLVVNVNKDGPTIGYSVEKNRQFFDVLCIRKNSGRDLGAYRDIFVFLKNQKKLHGNQIYFMNNSVIWFPEMIQSYFEELVGLEADVVAASVSNQYVEHIQTYLFGAGTESGVLAIQNWLFSVKNWRLKRTIVARGELETNGILTSDLRVVTFPSDSLVKVNALKKLFHVSTAFKNQASLGTLQRLQRNQDFAFAGIPVNPSHSFWLENLEAGFPGIKIDLVKNNPSGIQDYSDLVTKLNELGFGFDEISKMIYSNKNRSLTLSIRKIVKW
jgi:hypothetical protein